MLGYRGNQGARRRFLVLMNFSCFMLSLAPSVVAPPERGFSQGQPEMHQAMDNMVSHGILLKKTGPMFHQSNPINYPALLTSKTTHLVDEAEQALNTMQNPKEKQWVQTFVHYMRDMLKKTSGPTSQNVPKNLISNGTPVPVDLPSQTAAPEPSTVRGPYPFHKPSGLASKLPPASPELSQVQLDTEPASKHQAVTKPAMRLAKTGDDDDELVRELESLHEELAPGQPIRSPKVIAPTTDFTSPVTPVYPTSVAAQKKNMETDNQMMEAELLKELLLLKNRGSDFSQKIIDFLNGADSNTKSLTPKQETNYKTSGSKSEGIFDNSWLEQSDYNKNKEEKTVKAKVETLNAEKSLPYKAEDHHTLKENITNQNVPELPVLPKMNGQFPPELSLNKHQPYQWGFGHAFRPLLKQNSFDPHGNYRMNHRHSQIPEGLRQNMRPENRMHNNYAFSPLYNEYLSRMRYHSPYGYQQQWDQVNSTLQFPPGMTPYNAKQLINHQYENQLNDDMKRQLRDGKIVVLSDSVVRSNFDGKPGEKMNENERKNAMPVHDQKNNTGIVN